MHDPPPPSSAVVREDDAKYRLIYAKSKVYVNPTAYARDNIPGFAAIVRKVRPRPQSRTSSAFHSWPQEAFSSSYLLAWIPENLLTEKGPDEWDKFIKTEERPVEEDDDDDGMFHSGVLACPLLTLPPHLLDAVLIDMPTSRAESYAFSVPLSSIYSLIVQQPSLSSWCEQPSFHPRTRAPTPH